MRHPLEKVEGMELQDSVPTIGGVSKTAYSKLWLTEKKKRGGASLTLKAELYPTECAKSAVMVQKTVQYVG